MPLDLESDDTILFFGDSITDCGRDRSAPETSHGAGYVSQIAARLRYHIPSPELRILNLGISGNRIYDLESRMESEALATQPSVVSILIGINDTWRQQDRNMASPIDKFTAAYRQVLTQFRDSGVSRFVLLEPFLLPVPEDRRGWRTDLDPKIHAVRDLAVKFEADLLPLDGLFAQAATRAPAAYWLPDGVHPSPAGHALIAEAWLENAGLA